jgi:hypothetical protein
MLPGALQLDGAKPQPRAAASAAAIGKGFDKRNRDIAFCCLSVIKLK